MIPLRINCPPTWKNIVISSPGVLLRQKISHRSIQLPCASVLLRSVVIERGAAKRRKASTLLKRSFSNVLALQRYNFAKIVRVPGIGCQLVTTTSLGIAARYFVPVDHVPPGVEIVGTAVLVLKIVGVLPDIVAHDWMVAIHQWAVLVGGGDDLELATPIEDQPGPA